MRECTGAWSRAEVEVFLSETTIPLRLACHTPAGHLWMLSLWYRHVDDRLECATGADADVVGYLREDPRVAFEVSTNDPPYRGVRGRGTATIDADEDKNVLESLLVRYLGDTDSRLGRRLLAEDREEVAIRIEPERCYSWDFSERMRDVVEEG